MPDWNDEFSPAKNVHVLILKSKHCKIHLSLNAALPFYIRFSTLMNLDIDFILGLLLGNLINVKPSNQTLKNLEALETALQDCFGKWEQFVLQINDYFLWIFLEIEIFWSVLYQGIGTYGKRYCDRYLWSKKTCLSKFVVQNWVYICI